MKNFMELARLIAGIKETGEVVKLHLVTHNNEEYIMESKQHFQDMIDSLSPIDIEFTYERSEEHTSELQSRGHLVCRLLLEKKNKSRKRRWTIPVRVSVLPR